MSGAAAASSAVVALVAGAARRSGVAPDAALDAFLRLRTAPAWYVTAAVAGAGAVAVGRAAVTMRDAGGHTNNSSSGGHTRLVTWWDVGIGAAGVVALLWVATSLWALVAARRVVARLSFTPAQAALLHLAPAGDGATAGAPAGDARGVGTGTPAGAPQGGLRRRAGSATPARLPPPRPAVPDGSAALALPPATTAILRAGWDAMSRDANASGGGGGGGGGGASERLVTVLQAGLASTALPAGTNAALASSLRSHGFSSVSGGGGGGGGGGGDSRPRGGAGWGHFTAALGDAGLGGVADATAGGGVAPATDAITDEWGGVIDPYMLAPRSGAVDKAGKPVPLAAVLPAVADRLRVEEVSFALRRVVARHVLEVLTPALERNSKDLAARSGGLLKPEFLARGVRVTRFPLLRPGELTLDDIIGDMQHRNDTRYLQERPPLGGDAARPFRAVLRPLPAMGDGSRLRLFGSLLPPAPAPAPTAGGGGKGGGGGGVVRLWEERAVLEAFLAPPGTPAAERSGASRDPRAYVLARLQELARDGEMSGLLRDGWGVPAEEAAAAALPTDSAIFTNYVACLFDVEAAHASKGRATMLERPFSRRHVALGHLAREKRFDLPPGLDCAEVSKYLASDAGADADTQSLLLHVPAGTGSYTAYVMVENKKVDVGNTRIAGDVAPRAWAALLFLLFTAAGGRAGGVDMRDALAAVCLPSSTARGGTRRNEFRILEPL